MIRAFVFGLTLAIAIGPIALLILNTGLTHGFAASAMTAVGSTSADFIYAIVAFSAGHVFAPTLEAHHRLFGAAAAIALLVIGARIAVEGIRELRGAEVRAAASDARRSPLATGFALTMVNPMTIAGFAAFGTQLDLGDSWLAVLGYAIAAVCGTFLVSVLFAAAGGALAPLVRNTRTIGWLNVVSGTAIGAFGVAGLFR